MAIREKGLLRKSELNETIAFLIRVDHLISETANHMLKHE